MRSGSECADAADLPNVDRGVYSAQLSVKGHAKTKSEPVGITVNKIYRLCYSNDFA